MPQPSTTPSAAEAMEILSYLMLSPAEDPASIPPRMRALTPENQQIVLDLAHSNHVVIRGLERYRRIMLLSNNVPAAQWAEAAVATERQRIANALRFIHSLFQAFDAAGLDITVIKSLDHWPDFGSDIDLYTNAPSQSVIDLMRNQFNATLAERSWGDRLACKWNFDIPDLPESVEIHIGRLGQTGEQLVIASALPARSRQATFENVSLRIASPCDRIMISTLQRMYRHFYFRLCDIADSASLINSGALDFQELKSFATDAGIWEGVATYLVLVSDYCRRFTKQDLPLPPFVRESARFGGQVIYFGSSFLRVPIFPQSVTLYSAQLTELIRARRLESGARLGLLPWLATAAAIGYKITGSDKGIW